MWYHRLLLLATAVSVDGFAPAVSVVVTTNNKGGLKQRNYNPFNKFQKNHGALYQSTVPVTSASPANETSVVFGASSVAIPIKSSTPSRTSQITKTALSTSALLVLNFAFGRVLKHYGLSFPASLAGMGVLFATLLVAPFGESLYQVLKPGSNLMAKWLQVFLVPNLVVLPLAPGLGSTMEIAKVAAVIGGGFYATVLAVAWAVLGVRKLQPQAHAGHPATGAPTDEGKAIKTPFEAPAKPFSDATVQGFRKTALISTALGLVASRSGGLSGLSTPLVSLGMLAATFHNFVWGARLPKKVTKIFHPLVTCTSLTWLNLQMLGLALGTPFKAMIRTYKTGKLGMATGGAGDVLLFLLGPAIISLACQMYERRKLMRDNMAEVGTAIGVSTFGGMFGTAALVRLFGLGAQAKAAIGLSLISRNITSALAMVSGALLGADVCLTVSIAIVTGLLGANFGAAILDKWGIQDPVARGLAVGASAHGLGTAAMKDEKDAFPFAAIAMALTASISTVIVSIPFFRTALVKLALGV